MKRYPILEVCARIEGHEIQQQMLREYCRGFDDWQGLLERAEREGMAPLLRKHLAESRVDISVSVRRSLNILYKRHQKQAEVRLQVLEKVLQLFQQNQLTPILIKGSALCLNLYPDPALRPMRDMDILFSRDKVDQAQELLRGAGFQQSTAQIPPDHHHLPSLYKTVDNVKICFELHRGLYPDCPPWYPEVDFKNLLETGQKVTIGEIEAFGFSHEETLHYLYQHGCRAPLTFETYKLINVADIIGYVERYYQQVNWQQVKERFPGLFKSLPLMHHVSPWNFDKIPDTFISKRNRKQRLQPIPFRGWPQRRIKEFEGKVSLGAMLKKTFLPSRWWLRMYYGAGYPAWKFVKALCWDHQKNVFWWVHFYSHFVIETDTASLNPSNNFIGSVRLLVFSAWNKVRGVARKMLDV